MKKLIALLLVFAMALGMTACSQVSANDLMKDLTRIELILKMLEASKDNDKLKDYLINNTYLQRYLVNNKIMTDNTKQQVIETIVSMNSKDNEISNSMKNERVKKVLLDGLDSFSTYIQKSSYLENDSIIDESSKDYLKIKEYYNKLQSKYGMVNVKQLLLAQVALEYRDDTSEAKIKRLKNIEKFVELELKREHDKEMKLARSKEKILDKNEKKSEKRNKKQQNIKNAKIKADKRRKRDEEKYGKFMDFE